MRYHWRLVRADASARKARASGRRVMTSVATASLRERREAVVREHMESENRLEFEVTLRTFAHPRYELIATGEVYDGEDAVRGYYAASRAAFPDQRNVVHAIHHADDGVIVEFDLMGTHRGPLRGVPPTGREFTCRMVALFLFDGELLVCEH